MAKSLYNYDQRCYHVTNSYPEFLQFINSNAAQWSKTASELIGSWLYFSPKYEGSTLTAASRLAIVEEDNAGTPIVRPIDSASINYDYSTETETNQVVEYDQALNLYTIHLGNITELPNIESIGSSSTDMSIQAKSINISTKRNASSTPNNVISSENGIIQIGNASSHENINIGSTSLSSLVGDISINASRIDSIQSILDTYTASSIGSIFDNDFFYSSSYIQNGQFDFVLVFTRNGGSEKIALSTDESYEIYTKCGLTPYLYVYKENSNTIKFYVSSIYQETSGAEFKLDESNRVEIQNLNDSLLDSIDLPSDRYILVRNLSGVSCNIQLRKYGTLTLLPSINCIVRPYKKVVGRLSLYSTNNQNQPLILNSNILPYLNVNFPDSLYSQLSNPYINLYGIDYIAKPVPTNYKSSEIRENGNDYIWVEKLEDWGKMLNIYYNGTTADKQQFTTPNSIIMRAPAFSDEDMQKLTTPLTTDSNTIKYSCSTLNKNIDEINKITPVYNIWTSDMNVSDQLDLALSSDISIPDSNKRLYPTQPAIIALISDISNGSSVSDTIFNGTGIKKEQYFEIDEKFILFGFTPGKSTIIITPELKDYIETHKAKFYVYTPGIFWQDRNGASPFFVSSKIYSTSGDNENQSELNWYNRLNGNIYTKSSYSGDLSKVLRGCINQAKYLYEMFTRIIYNDNSTNISDICQSYPGLILSNLLYRKIFYDIRVANDSNNSNEEDETNESIFKKIVYNDFLCDRSDIKGLYDDHLLPISDLSTSNVFEYSYHLFTPGFASDNTQYATTSSINNIYISFDDLKI